MCRWKSALRDVQKHVLLMSHGFLCCGLWFHVMCLSVFTHVRGYPMSDDCHHRCSGGRAVGRTANLRVKILDFRGFDSSKILIFSSGILVSIGISPEVVLRQEILVGIILVGRFGADAAPRLARPSSLPPPRLASPPLSGTCVGGCFILGAFKMLQLVCLRRSGKQHCLQHRHDLQPHVC